MSSAKEILDAFNLSPKKGLDKLLANSEYVGKEADAFLAAEGAYNRRKEYLKLAEKVAGDIDARASSKMNAMDEELGISFDQRLAYEKAFKSVQNANPGELKEAQQQLEVAQKVILGNTKEELERVRKELTTTKATEIAKFLHANHKELNLHALGEFLGEELNVPVLNEFTKQMDFNGKNFDNALRDYLSKFNLPGESQKIERMMGAFGRVYSKVIEMNEDAAFILGYSTIMLTTDLHNPENKQKMTKEQFIQNNRGIDDGNDLDKDMLTKLYDSIALKPIKLDVAQTAPGFTISASAKSKDKLFGKINDLFGKSEAKEGERGKEFDVTKTIKTIFPYENIEKATIDKPKSWLKRLMGYEGRINLKTEQGNEVTIQCYKPSFFSKSKTPRLIVQPSHENMHPNEKSLELAASIASKFERSSLKMEATYDYSKDAIIKSYDTAKKEKPLDLQLPKTTMLDKLKASIGLGNVSSKSPNRF